MSENETVYQGQPLFGKFNSWYVGADGVTRNRWTGETVDEMQARHADSLRALEERGMGKTEVARALRHAAKVGNEDAEEREA